MSFRLFFFFFSSRRRHTRWPRDWSSDVCSSDLDHQAVVEIKGGATPVDAPQNTRKLQHAFGVIESRWGKHALVAHALELDAAVKVIKRRGAPGMCAGKVFDFLAG